MPVNAVSTWRLRQEGQKFQDNLHYTVSLRLRETLRQKTDPTNYLLQGHTELWWKQGL